jgi:hypothetical protein
MRQTKSGPELSKRAFLGLLLAAALVSPAWTYVNGGDYHDTFKDYEKSLKARGWGVSSGAAVPADRDVVNQLVGRALQALPPKDAGKISIETKREIARLTQEAIRLAASNNLQTTKEGQIGSLRYQVGVYSFESYWETNYGGKREIHARRTGRIPFVALKMVDVKQSRGRHSG